MPCWTVQADFLRNKKQFFLLTQWMPFVILPEIGMMVRVFADGSGDRGSIPGRVIPKTQKWYLIPPCLTLSIIRYGSRVKWSNPGKGVASSPSPWCSSYWKGSLWVSLDSGGQLYVYYYVRFFILQSKIIYFLVVTQMHIIKEWIAKEATLIATTVYIYIYIYIYSHCMIYIYIYIGYVSKIRNILVEY